MIQVKDLKKGDVIYECQYGVDYRCVCLEDARSVKGEWRCRVKTTDRKLELMEAHDCGIYGLRLHDKPVYGNVK